MKQLTEAERTAITMEMIRSQPLETLGTVTLLKLGELAIETGAKNIKLSTEGTIEGDRYMIKMVITHKKL